jgi:hypothetical protein
MKPDLFRKESIQRISSPEQLDDYIHVSNPSVWIVIAAVIVLIAGAIVWMVTSTLETNIAAYAVKEEDGIFIAYISPDKATAIRPGAKVMLGGSAGSVKGVQAAPLSYTEARLLLPSDYAAYALGLGEWNVRVTLTSDAAVNAPGDIAPVTITTSSESPLNLIF